MTDPVAEELSDQFTAEYRSKQRQFVLDGIDARWRLIAIAVFLLAATGLNLIVANTIGILLGFVWNYLLSEVFVWRGK